MRNLSERCKGESFDADLVPAHVPAACFAGIDLSTQCMAGSYIIYMLRCILAMQGKKAQGGQPQGVFRNALHRLEQVRTLRARTWPPDRHAYCIRKSLRRPGTDQLVPTHGAAQPVSKQHAVFVQAWMSSAERTRCFELVRAFPVPGLVTALHGNSLAW